MQERPDRVVLHPPLPETRCALHQVSLTWRQPDRHATTTTENHMVVIVPDRRDFRELVRAPASRRWFAGRTG